MAQPDTVLPYRIGVVLLPRKRLNEAALRFLVLSMNTQQNVFQFEFYDPNPDDELLSALDSRGEVCHEVMRRHLDGFADRMHDYLAELVADFQLTECPPRRFVVISHCVFDDNYYSTGRHDSSVIALGNWKRYMAPPSLLEFAQSLLVDEVVSLLCPSLRAGHLGTKAACWISMKFSQGCDTKCSEVLYATFVARGWRLTVIPSWQASRPNYLIENGWVPRPIRVLLLASQQIWATTFLSPRVHGRRRGRHLCPRSGWRVLSRSPL